MNLKNSYESFTDCATGDEMYEETFRLFPDAGKYDDVVGAWSPDTNKAEQHILERFVSQHGTVTEDEQAQLHGLIFYDLTGS